MRKLGCFVALVMMFTASEAFCSDLTLFGGIQREGKLTLQNATSSATSTTPTLFTLNPSSFGTFGLRFGLSGKKIFGQESTFAYSPNFIASGTKAVILNHNLMLQAPLPALKPYVTVGIGTVITKGSGYTDIGTKFAFNYGGGIKAMAGPVGARFDIRGYGIPSVHSQASTTGPSIQSQTLNVIEVSLGVVFAIGK